MIPNTSRETHRELGLTDSEHESIIERLARKQCFVHAVDEMRAGIGQRFALFGDVEIPGRPPVRHARYRLEQLMRIAERDPGFGGISRDGLAEHLGVKL